MALGVSSYADRTSRRRRRREVTTAYGPARGRFAWPAWMGRLEGMLVEAWPLVRFPLTLLAVAHLIGVALLPGGRNALFGLTLHDAPGYLSWFQVPDALGFYTTHGTDAFLVYKIYTQDGGVVDGVFPDTGVAPKLRYDRWATAGDAAAGPHPQLHAFVTRYVLDHLPSPPLRLELYSARWQWDRNSLTFPWPGTGPETELSLRRLGSYNGLTRTWDPVTKEGQSR